MKDKDTRQIRLIKAYNDRDEWKKDIPDLVYNLKYGYNFYYNKMCVFTADIEKTLANTSYKHKHKIILYFNREDDIYYLTIFKKYTIDIYSLGWYSNSPNYLTRYKTAQTWMKMINDKYEIAAQKRFNEQ